MPVDALRDAGAGIDLHVISMEPLPSPAPVPVCSCSVVLVSVLLASLS